MYYNNRTRNENSKIPLEELISFLKIMNNKSETNMSLVCAERLEDYGVQIKQYKNLRRHFTKLTNLFFGTNYHNEGCDVYSCDEFTCRDIWNSCRKFRSQKWTGICGFSVGENVKIDNKYCYKDYIKFIENYREYAIRWAFNDVPNCDDEYKIIGIHKAIFGSFKSCDIACEYVFVVESRKGQLFLVGDKGIKEA